MNTIITYSFRLGLLLSLLGLGACNTTQEKKPEVSSQPPTSQSTQGTATQASQDNAPATQQNPVNEASTSTSSQVKKSDDEILNDALEELERKKTKTTIEEQKQNPSASGNTATASPSPRSVPATGSATSIEKNQQLDSELDEGFAEFDALLLKEQERLTQEQNEQGDLSTSGGTGAASGGYGYEEGSQAYENGIDDASIASEEQAQATGGSNPFPSNNTQADIPPDLVSTKGDDVIARQLREAALKEKDPELREKLWDEYRKYKQGIGR